ncbi:MAG: efflux RND transporter permease subunit, partial [Beijerinckiaceae bacterium]
LGVGDGGEFRAPMAIGVIGGLLVSTVLSLVFVPSFYSVVDSISRLISRLFSGFAGPKEDDDVPAQGPPVVTKLMPKPETRLAAE